MQERHTILYIDDEIHSLNAFRLTFEEDFEIFTANNTSEGYRTLKEHKIDLIISDQRMPVETGVDFLSRIRDEFPDTIRTILTGYSDIDSVIEAINASHVYYYFKKPWNETELRLALRNAIEASELAAKNLHLVASLRETMLQLELKSKELQTQLLERESLVRELEKSNETKSQFLSVISHELRTPLNPIIGLSDMVAKSLPLGDTRESVSMIYRCGHDLLKMINSILEFIQVDRKKSVLPFEPIDLYAFIKDSHTLAKSLIVPSRNVSVVSELTIDGTQSEESIFILTDRDSLRHIVHNLISNACKFTQKGEIKISSRLNRTSTDECDLEIAISDTGIGIKKEDQERIFEAFTQVDQTLSRNYEGLGLGLAIGQQHAKHLEAELNVASEWGRGSTFTLSLKVKLVEPRIEKLETNGLPPKSQKGRRALIVEDNPHNMSMMQAILSKLGLEVTTAKDGSEALQALAHLDFHYIFLDLHIPEIDGYEVASRVRKMSLFHQPHIIATTADTITPTDSKLRTSGIDSILFKPISFTEIQEQLSLYC